MNASPPISKVNSELLRTTKALLQMVQMCNSIETKQSHGINFVIADIAFTNMILGIEWLQKLNSNILKDTGGWPWHTHTDVEDRLMGLVSACTSIATMCTQYMHGYKLHLHKLGLDLDCDTA
jgi:hypothetical protein